VEISDPFNLFGSSVYKEHYARIENSIKDFITEYGISKGDLRQRGRKKVFVPAEDSNLIGEAEQIFFDKELIITSYWTIEIGENKFTSYVMEFF